MSVATTKGEPFFYYFNALMLITVIAAFGIYALFDMHKLNSPGYVIAIHATSMFLWYGLLFYQSGLIRSRQTKLHMKLGMMSIVLAVIIVVSGITIGITNFQGEGEPIILIGNFTGMLIFSVLYTLAVINRYKPDVHKRLIIVASVAMLSPALVRLLRVADVNDFITLPLWLIFMAALPVYDYKKQKKVHKTTWLATGFLLVLFFAGIPVGFSDSFRVLMESIFIN